MTGPIGILHIEIEGGNCYVWGKPGAGAVAWRRTGKEDEVLSQHFPAVDGTTGTGAFMETSPDSTTSERLLALIHKSLDDDKAEDVVTIDLRGRSEMADYMVVASGRSARQVSAIAEKLSDRLKEALGHRARSEGMEQGDWVLIDVFRPEVRDFYQIEKMWMPAARAGRG